MRNSKKLLVLFLTLVISLGFLTGCGIPFGVYRSENGESLNFDGGSLSMNAFGVDGAFGYYKIKGGRLYFTYSTFGYKRTDSYSYSKKGDTIFLDNVSFTKNSGGQAGVSVDAVIIAAAIILAGGLGATIIARGKRRGEKDSPEHSVDRDVHDTLYRTSKTIASSAVEVGSRVAATTKNLTSSVSAGVSAGITAGKAAAKERQTRLQEQRGPEIVQQKSAGAKKEAPKPDGADDWEEVSEADVWEEATEADDWEEVSAPTRQPSGVEKSDRGVGTAPYAETRTASPGQPAVRIRIDPTHCCLCGRPLDDHSVQMKRLPSGRVPWLDSNCLRELAILSRTNNYIDFEEAAASLKSRILTCDPEVEKALLTYIRKSEDRIYREYLK